MYLIGRTSAKARSYFLFIKGEITIKKIAQIEYAHNSVYEKQPLPTSLQIVAETKEIQAYQHVISNSFKDTTPFTLEEWETLEIENDRAIIGGKTFMFDSKEGYYSTKNPTSSDWSRKKIHLIGYNLISIDIDNHNKSNTHKIDSLELISNITADLIDTGVIPTPDDLVFTGRGLQVRYKFDLVDTSFEREYQATVNELIEILSNYMNSHQDFKKFEVDTGASINPVQPIRLGGINQKNGNQVTYYNNPQQHTLESLIEHLAVQVKPIPKQSLESLKTLIARERIIATPYTVTHLNNGLKFMLEHRLKTIDKVKTYHEENNKEEGYRYNLLFLYSNIVKQINPTIAQDLTINYNNSFIKPLDDKELEEVLNLIPKKHIFRFKTDKFKGWLAGKNSDIAKMIEVNPDKNPTRTQQRAIKREQNIQRDKYIIELLNVILVDGNIPYLYLLVLP